MTDEHDRGAAHTTGYHRIKSIAVTGGFLEGLRLEFCDDLNCIIGGRGTGKTSVLEAIRFGLDRMPDLNLDRSRFQAIERLLQHNLGGGSVRIEIETSDGAAYTIARGIGEAPLVTNSEGRPTEINIGKDIIFGVDLYSQNQIEDIANDAFFQLQLIDKFIRGEVDDLERQIRETTKALETNSGRILETRKALDDLTEATRELPDISEKIRGFEKTDKGGAGEVLRKEHELKGLRTREMQVADSARALFAGGMEALASITRDLKQRYEDAFDVDLAVAPNRELIGRMRDSAQTAIETVDRSVDVARKGLATAEGELKKLQTQLVERQSLQEKAYRELVEKHEQERVKGVERTRLEQRHADLKGKEKKLLERKVALSTLNAEREQLRIRLSELRDQRFRLRVGVAERLNKHLAPMIRVRIEQFGNMDEYRNLLNQSMKGSGLRYAAIVDRAVERIPPAELASLIQKEDHVGLERELDLDTDRATRMIIQLKDKPELFAIETVELHDRPILELLDGEDYKDSSSLSTGQKCTTILPILLIESERPLLIDQPEDNLDNAFVFETIVRSIAEIRGRRQLIFVTHNPNIPVLGDAARVFALRSTGRSASVANAGTVDDVAQEIMTILEGGRSAFEARRKRYGRPVPSIKGT
ncbi:MAG TPA: AAA family ATPase [Kofleriaceae bacterium]|nr:AAA family ATPase [Kofleriaceae bacterium]